MLRICQPDDFHVHVRQGPPLVSYVRDLAGDFARVMVMPNTLPPMQNAQQIAAYRAEILQAAADYPGFNPLMTFKVTSSQMLQQKNKEPDGSLPELASICKAFVANSVIAGKLYPQGVTTNSEDGVRDIEELYPLFQVMADQGIVLSVHGEDPEAFCLDREKAFLPRMEQVRRDFPTLSIVLEHLSSAAAVEWVAGAGERVAATITIHHLLFTLDDVLGGHLNPHLFCKPLLKTPLDRQALRSIVLEGHPRFFYGSDSAPHTRDKKESCCGAAGVYSGPLSLALLAEWFETNGCLEKLEAFVSQFGADFYALPRNSGTIELERRPWTVPQELHGVVPLCAGQTLAWQVVR